MTSDSYATLVSRSSRKVFACDFPQCGQSFLYKSELTKHSHTHSSYKTLKCPNPDCWKFFKRSDTLENHIRLHTGEKPFVCQERDCGLKFVNKAGLRYHLLKHKNVKKYQCTVEDCDKSFLTLAQLKQHEHSGAHAEKVAAIARRKKSSIDFSRPYEPMELDPNGSGTETGYTAGHHEETDHITKKIKSEEGLSLKRMGSTPNQDWLAPLQINPDAQLWRLPEWTSIQEYFQDL